MYLRCRKIRKRRKWEIIEKKEVLALYERKRAIENNKN